MFEGFFTLTINFVTASALAIEKFTPAKQEMIKKRYGDMRLPVMETFKKMWATLDAHQTKFIKALVGPFLELAMLEEPELKEAGLTLYYSTLTREFSASHSFRGVETQTIDALDKIVNERLISAPSGSRTNAGISSVSHFEAQQASESFKKYFRLILKERFEMEQDEQLKKQGLVFLQDMQELLDLFTKLRVLPNDVAYADERTEATLQLMQYLKQTDRSDKYVKYVHDLCKQQEDNGNFVEAGLTLLLHADLLNWSEDKVEPMGPFKTQDYSWQRKEELFFRAVDYFDKGKMWEKAIDLMEKLRVQYQRVLFDYTKLSTILARQARFFRNIASEERFYADYFYVGYWGHGFPPNLANKQFIYRGFELEHSRDFQARISSAYPTAEILNFTEPPGDEVRNSYKQQLQIYTVKPASIEEMEGRERAVNERMPPSIKKFILYNDVNVFVYAKPFRKGPKNKDNEFEDLWIRNTYFRTEDHFPSVRRRLQIVDTRVLEVAPVQNAVNGMSTKNDELKEIIAKYSSSNAASLPLNPFTMVLNGVIDAAVSGGVAMYQKAFLTPQFAQANPDCADKITQLKRNIVYQVDILDVGLGIHASICSADMAGLQEQLELKFDQLKKGIAEYRASLPAGSIPKFTLPNASQDQKQKTEAGLKAEADGPGDDRATPTTSAPTPHQLTPGSSMTNLFGAAGALKVIGKGAKDEKKKKKDGK